MLSNLGASFNGIGHFFKSVATFFDGLFHFGQFLILRAVHNFSLDIIRGVTDLLNDFCRRPRHRWDLLWPEEDQEYQGNEYELASTDVEQKECMRHEANLNKKPRCAARNGAPFKYQFSYFSFDASNITGVAMNNEL